MPLSAQSNETLWVEVSGQDPDLGALDPTTYDVELGFADPATVPVDWFPAEWGDTHPTRNGRTYYRAKLEVGPGAGTVEFTAGQPVQVFIRISTPDETPVIAGPVFVPTV